MENPDSETIVPSAPVEQQPARDRTRRNADNLLVDPEGPKGGLETRNLHAWFDKHHALEDVSLHFPENTVTGLIGPSGCGKSTFLRLLNRMHEFIPRSAMAGEVLFEGHDAASGWCSRSRTRSPQ
jgi:phosphate transport system ATP-binding protein